MDPYSSSSERSAVDFFLFALAFVAFMMAVAGVVVASKAVAVAGGLLLLLAIALS